jgi:murein DD-endopeptidase MepM/ murein hydrolase activator NlpD
MATFVPDTTHTPQKGVEAAPAAGRRWKSRATATVGALLALAALAVAAPGTGHALPSDVPIDQVERERQANQQKQAEVAAQLDAAKANSQDLIAALTTLDQQVNDQMARSAETERAYKDADRRFAEIQAVLSQNQLEVDRINNELRQQAVRRYVKPEDDDSSVRLLKANDFDEAQQKKVLSDAVAGNSQDLIEQMRGARGRLDGLRQQADEARAEAEARRKEQADLFLRIVGERDAQARLQAEWDKRVASLSAAGDKLHADAVGLDQAIAAQRGGGGGGGGSSAPAPQSSNGRFIWPVSGKMGDGYGGARNHPGVDILDPVGTPIWAVLGGKVTRADSGGGYNGGYGNLVVIQHGNGLETRYAHQSTVRVSVGQSVTQGQVIGNVGMTGDTTGPHLHFEVYLNGVRQNPSNYLP